MIKELIERYQNYIYFAEKDCKKDLICFKDMTDYFVRCNTTQFISLH